MQTTKTPSAAALVGIWTVLLTAFVIATLYFARDILIPLALAGLLTFLLSPLVTRIEHWIGRIAAVLSVVVMLFSVAGVAGWILTLQLIDFAERLPDYKDNIQTKLRSFQVPSGGAFTRFSQTLEELKRELPGIREPGTRSPANGAPVTTPPIPVSVVESAKNVPGEFLQMALAPLLGPLGTGGLVLLLLIFMLMKREDLRGRLIRLIGQGRISATTRAMDDAGSRVTRYLLMQLVVNVTYGIPVAVGLALIGVPNAILWGVFSAVLRFIPYVGPWIAAAAPIALSLAVSTSWVGPLLTIGLFVILEIISNNVMEPWLYGSSTGISSMALIVAAVFWTWLWGPVGLVLATPLTVCLAVMGRHVQKLEFLSVLLSDKEALTPHEECYHRLLAIDPNEASEFVDTYLKTKSVTSLYDEVLIPVLGTAEMDHRREHLDQERRLSLQQAIREIVDDLGNRSFLESVADKNLDKEGSPFSLPCRVLGLSARAERDELAGGMLLQLLRQQGFEAENAAAKLTTGELLELVDRTGPEAVVISVVAPSTVIQARYLTTKLRSRFSGLKIVVGLWGATENLPGTTQRLRASGADHVVVSLAETLTQLAKYSLPMADEIVPIPSEEEERLVELKRLNLLGTEPEELFDRLTSKLVRIFGVPTAWISFVAGGRQMFKSQIGLPEDLAQARVIPIKDSVCGYVIHKNEAVYVEDVARDRRFVRRSFLKERGFRFYAAVPLRVPGGRPIGSLCLLDIKPRQMTDSEKRLLEVMAEELMAEIALRSPRELPGAPPLAA